MKVVIEKGEVEGKTVAKVDAQIHQEKRLNAEQLIAQDPFIQQLQKEFGAKVVGGSVKPI
jgi:DNA polymerase-3 subunit gamma/tau